jgi:hypothetical protein
MLAYHQSSKQRCGRNPNRQKSLLVQRLMLQLRIALAVHLRPREALGKRRANQDIFKIPGASGAVPPGAAKVGWDSRRKRWHPIALACEPTRKMRDFSLDPGGLLLMGNVSKRNNPFFDRTETRFEPGGNNASHFLEARDVRRQKGTLFRPII